MPRCVFQYRIQRFRTEPVPNKLKQKKQQAESDGSAQAFKEYVRYHIKLVESKALILISTASFK